MALVNVYLQGFRVTYTILSTAVCIYYCASLKAYAHILRDPSVGTCKFSLYIYIVLLVTWIWKSLKKGFKKIINGGIQVSKN